MKKSVINKEIELNDNENIILIIFQKEKIKIFWECPEDNQIFSYQMAPRETFIRQYVNGGLWDNNSMQIYANRNGEYNKDDADRINNLFDKEKESADEFKELTLERKEAETLYENLVSYKVVKSLEIKKAVINTLNEHQIDNDLSSPLSCIII